MNCPPVLSIQAAKPSFKIILLEPLPRWENLPPEQRRELVMTLATMLVKQLSVQRPAREKAAHE